MKIGASPGQIIWISASEQFISFMNMFEKLENWFCRKLNMWWCRAWENHCRINKYIKFYKREALRVARRKPGWRFTAGVSFGKFLFWKLSISKKYFQILPRMISWSFFIILWVWRRDAIACRYAKSADDTFWSFFWKMIIFWNFREWHIIFCFQKY